MNKTRQKFAAVGALTSFIYLASNNLLPGLPDFLMGFTMGMSLIFLLLALLPEPALARIRKWKGRG